MQITLKNSRGQSLIEYLIIVAIIAVGSIGIVKTLGSTVKVRFANITNALQGKETAIQADAPNQEDYKKRGLDDFFQGAGH
jgi:pilus assembly protein Flp/PilA